MSLSDLLPEFRQVMAIVCCVFGLPGNVLTIIVCIKAFLHRQIHSESKVFDLYMIEISLLDTYLLLYWVIDTLISYLHSIDRIEFFSLMHLSGFSCFSSFILNRLCAALSSCLITCFTLIRFLNIFRQFNTIKSNVILLMSLLMIFSLTNSYAFVALEYDSSSKHVQNSSHPENHTLFSHRTFCHIRAEYADDHRILLVNTLVAGVLNLALPSVLVLIVNMITISYIKRIYSKKSNRRSDGTLHRSTRSTLLVISITYTLFYLPYCISYFLMISLEDRNDTLHHWSEITYILRHVSHSVNFYAYLFTNFRFRRDIAALFRWICQPWTYWTSRLQSQKKKKSRGIIIEIHRLPLPQAARSPML